MTLSRNNRKAFRNSASDGLRPLLLACSCTNKRRFYREQATTTATAVARRTFATISCRVQRLPNDLNNYTNYMNCAVCQGRS